jgi:hypothetical protein
LVFSAPHSFTFHPGSAAELQPFALSIVRGGAAADGRANTAPSAVKAGEDVTGGLVGLLAAGVADGAVVGGGAWSAFGIGTPVVTGTSA